MDEGNYEIDMWSRDIQRHVPSSRKIIIYCLPTIGNIRMLQMRRKYDYATVLNLNILLNLEIEKDPRLS